MSNFMCSRCDISINNRHYPVLGVGKVPSELMIIGEAPGYHEVKFHIPFIGRAGQKLNYVLSLFNIKRDDIYITNIIKCRPTNNRTPSKLEIDNCRRIIKTEFELVNPSHVILLGRVALQTYFGCEDLKISEARGRIIVERFKSRLRLVIATYHPSYILRHPEHLSTIIWDFKQILRFYAAYVPNNNINLNV